MANRSKFVHNGDKYETVAASATDQALGPVGDTGDYLARILLIPASTSPGAVSIKDGAGAAITIFTGGVTSIMSLEPIRVDIGARSTGGSWKVTTGAAISAICIGDFT